ncbi:MAG: BON domain-containing protein [Planctomycetes bacterium]|nr:BON domain-containing protein [Planctomycetota bacterium]
MRHVLLLALLLLPACRGYRDPEDSVELRRSIDDSNAATRVRIALGEDPQTAPYAAIKVSCEGGVLTLEGDVDRAAVRARAGDLASVDPAVRKVRNRISVRTASSPR